MQQETDPDLALLIRLAAGEPQAMRQLVARKLPALLALAQRMLGDRAEAEDVAQETLVRVWRNAPFWRPGEARFDSWLYRVALNLCLDRLRARHERPADDARLPENADPTPAPIELLAGRQRSAQIKAALAKLSPRQRQALVLQYFQGLPLADVAGLMDLSEEALESLLIRARRKLRELLLDAKSKESL